MHPVELLALQPQEPVMCTRDTHVPATCGLYRVAKGLTSLPLLRPAALSCARDHLDSNGNACVSSRTWLQA
jgi:hypothetical protein